MAVHQYIGARYVPKFYENPNNTADWLSNVIYEPLTIVTYNNDSYTSKKTVPASIGDPANNPDYWVATGNFNAQVSDLSDDVDNLSDEVDLLKLKVKFITPEVYHNDSDTDWNNAFTSAINYANTNQIPVLLTGTYYLTTSFNIPAGVNIVGKGAYITTSDFGPASVTQNALGDNVTDNARILFVLNNNSSISGIKFSTQCLPIRVIGSNVRIFNCDISTENTSGGYGAYYAIDLKSASNVTIDGINVLMSEGGYNRDGIHINGSCSNIKISNCYIYCGDDPIALNAVEEASGAITNVFVSNCFLSGYGVRLYSKNSSTKISNVFFDNCVFEGRTIDNVSAAALRFINGWGMNDNNGYTGVYETIGITNCKIKNDHSDYSSLYFNYADITDLNITNSTINNIGANTGCKLTGMRISDSIVDSVDLRGVTLQSRTYISNTDIYILKYASLMNMALSNCMLDHIEVDSNSANSYTRIVNTNLYGSQNKLYGTNEYIIEGTRFSGGANPIDNETGEFIVKNCSNTGLNLLVSLGTAKRFVGIAWSESLHPTDPVEGDTIYYANNHTWQIYDGTDWKTITVS